MSRREVIVASAGSGKTFRISSRIIELLASGVEPASIFASTFTRKAAGEILDRVLLRLGEAAAMVPAGTPPERTAAAALAGQLDLSLPEGAGDPTTPDFWQGVLTRTVRSLHRLDISTLDAFFRRTLGSFAYEVGLPPGWGVADEATLDRVRADALDGVLGVADRGAMVEVLRALHQGDVRRSVHEALGSEAEDLLRVDEALVAGASSDAAPGWAAMRRAIGPRPDDLEDRCARAAERILSAPLKPKADGSPDVRWLKAARKAAEVVRDRAWVDYLGGGLYKNVLTAAPGEPPAYYSHPMEAELVAALEAAGAIALLDLGSDLAARAEAMGRLAGYYRTAWQRRLLSTGRLRFEDVTRLLVGGSTATERAELMYRFDGEARHLLLDEYQDTSLLQWRALEPAVDAIIGPPERPRDGHATVVADPKQSIYGWRGAAPVVVDAVTDRYALEQTSLAASWRSSQVVLDVVNRVFDGIHDAPLLQERAVDADVAARWGEAFQPHHEAEGSRGHPKPGFVTLEVGPEKLDRREVHREMCAHVAARVAELAQTHPGRSIGVLTRRNDTIALIMHELGLHGVPASEEGGSAITDSAAVVSVLALFRLVDHPGHGLARYHAARTPIGSAVVDLLGSASGLGESVGVDASVDEQAAVRVAHHLRQQLLVDGYGAVLRDLHEQIRAHCDERDEVRMRQLVELGYAWDASPDAGLRTDDFVRLARATRGESPGNEAVRVMTIHGSKGLEFDIVVLPELHANMFGRGSNAPLAWRPIEHGAATHAFPPISKKIAPLFDHVPGLQEARGQERAGQVRDALGTLYVGMTRARHALHMLVPDDGEKPTATRSPGRLLRERLGVAAPDVQATEGSTIFAEGDAEWHDSAEPSGFESPTGGRATPRAISLRRGQRTRMLERRSPSSEEGGDAVDLKLRLGVTGGGGRTWGTLVHAILEEVEWLDPSDVPSGLPSEDTVRTIAARETPELEPDAALEALARLRTQLTAPEVIETLTHPDASDATRYQVARELPFLTRDGDRLVEGVIDRLVLELDAGGEPSAAEIVDWKTDAIAPGDEAALDGKVQYYAPQISRYREAVADLYGLAPERIRATLVFLAAGAVRDVSLD